ncbi:hypothetical protein [Wukongibacter sp. M2B1]|uniref:hypothetical protein n=1 Tax=Wukongibacter sp. M2B1 TaxID=3088895 RepID=UPI003D79BF38
MWKIVNSLISNIRRLRYNNTIKKVDKTGRNIIYIAVTSLNYWWGNYGFSEKTGWEDIGIYVKDGNRFKKLGWICICARSYLEHGLEELENDPDEMSFVKEIKGFLKDDEIKYHYYYDNPNYKDFYEVPFEAERNEMNVKPRSMEIWHPGGGIDKGAVDDCVRSFMKKFLDINVERIVYKDIVSPEEALQEYVEEMERWEQYKGVVFSDDLIQSLEDKWKISKEKVLEILNRSTK